MLVWKDGVFIVGYIGMEIQVCGIGREGEGTVVEWME